MADKSDQVRLVEGREIYRRMADLLDGRPVKWLSDATGISSSTFSDMKNGKVPRPESLILVSKALKVDLEWLLTGRMESRDALDRDRWTGERPAVLLGYFERLSIREQDAVIGLARILAEGGGQSVDITTTLHSPTRRFRERLAGDEEDQ